MLLEAAEEAYPELLSLACDYVEKASEYQKLLKKPQYEKKAKVGCITNTMKPGDVDKYTIVIFLEGDDPDCLNNLIGGEIKMHMDITEEHIEENK